MIFHHLEIKEAHHLGLVQNMISLKNIKTKLKHFIMSQKTLILKNQMLQPFLLEYQEASMTRFIVNQTK